MKEKKKKKRSCPLVGPSGRKDKRVSDNCYIFQLGNWRGVEKKGRAKGGNVLLPL